LNRLVHLSYRQVSDLAFRNEAAQPSVGRSLPAGWPGQRCIIAGQGLIRKDAARSPGAQSTTTPRAAAHFLSRQRVRRRWDELRQGLGGATGSNWASSPSMAKAKVQPDRPAVNNPVRPT